MCDIRYIYYFLCPNIHYLSLPILNAINVHCAGKLLDELLILYRLLPHLHQPLHCHAVPWARDGRMFGRVARDLEPLVEAFKQRANGQPEALRRARKWREAIFCDINQNNVKNSCGLAR